jgi:hypothetical protein
VVNLIFWNFKKDLKMKKMIFAAMMLVVSSFAQAQVAYPGSSWGVVTFPAGISDQEKNNVLAQGKAEQGVDLKVMGAQKQWTLNTYASLGYSIDRNKLDYNNKITPAIGVKMTRKFSSAVVDMGVQAYHENHFVTHTSGNGVQAYVSYWSGWNLNK